MLAFAAVTVALPTLVRLAPWRVLLVALAWLVLAASCFALQSASTRRQLALDDSIGLTLAVFLTLGSLADAIVAEIAARRARREDTAP
jgi:hypothetical protein